EALHEAAREAEASREDRLGARARIQLVHLLAVRRREARRAHRYADYAAAALDRLGGDAELEGLLANHRGSLSFHEAQYADAAASYRMALALRERVLGADHPEVAAIHSNLGFALRRGAQLDAALFHLRRAVQIHKRVLGPGHPEVAISLNNLGPIYFQRG